MARPRKPVAAPDPTEPHAFAWLAEWRDHGGYTQDEVADMFSVSGVTIHRWETGKAPVTAANYIKLAKLYRAPNPGALMFPVSRAQHAAQLQAASRLLDAMPPEKRQRWLEVGGDMAGVPAPRTEEILPDK